MADKKDKPKGFYWIYTFQTELALEELYSSMESVAQLAAAGIDGDMHEALTADPDYDLEQEWPLGMADARYWEMAEWLYLMHQTNDHAFLYTYVSSGPGEVEFILSHGAVMDPVAGAPYGFAYQPQPPSKILEGLEKETRSTNYIVDDWGAWISGFVPIENSNGEIVATLGVDYEVSTVVALQDRIKAAAIPAFVSMYAVLLVSVLVISNGIAGPIIALTRVAERIAEGVYDLADVRGGMTRDEVTTLTEIFNLMVDKVRVREEKLKTKVAELQIVIDQQRKEEEVSSIVDTDFFNELQDKAKQMRSRHQKRRDEEKEA